MNNNNDHYTTSESQDLLYFILESLYLKIWGKYALRSPTLS